MKRFLTVLVALVLMAAMASTAVAEYSEPILFRNIPWGSTKAHVLSQLPTPWLDLGPYTYENLMDLNNFRYGEAQKYQKGNVYFLESLSYKDLNVAGYETKTVHLYYAYSVTSDGLPDENIDNGRLFAAEYVIEPTDRHAVYDDLVGKLSGLYGAPDFKFESHKVIDYTYNTWKGKDETSVTLMMEEYSSGTCKIHIRYTTQAGVDMQNEVLEATIKKENQSAANNTSGL